MHARDRKRALVALLASAMAITAMPAIPVAAQDAPPVLILPIDNANFLPGAKFDLRVEVWADAMPEDFAVTVNGTPAAEVFPDAVAEEASWTAEDALQVTQTVVWRDLMLPAAGDYEVAVTAGGETTTVDWTAHEPSEGAGARNVVFFVADGMQVGMLTAARLVSMGMTEGKYDGELNIDKMSKEGEIGLVHSSGMDSIITDSANSASAYNTGHKSAVNALGVYPDSSLDTIDDPKQETFAELIDRVKGMRTGIVTTSEFQDATPAAVFAHTRRRSDKNLISTAPLDQDMAVDVILAGGGAYLLPASVEGTRREDERDVFSEYEAAGYTVAENATGLAEAVASGAEKVLGIFHPTNMSVWLDRNVYTENLGDLTDQPGLVDMTLAALDILGDSENGFYLMVEAASVDKAMHPLDQERTLADLIEFDQAVGAAMEWAAANAPDTLFVVTADHGHGYDVYGTVDVAAFNAGTTDLEKRAAIGVYNEAGFPTYEDADGDGFPDDWNASVVLAGFVNNTPEYTEDFQVSSVPRVPSAADAEGVYRDNPDDDPNGIFVPGNLPPDSDTGVHTLQDVPIFAWGPGAEAFGHVMDNTEVFFGMASAVGLDPLADEMAE
jgi:alkaline phosphatase